MTWSPATLRDAFNVGDVIEYRPAGVDQDGKPTEEREGYRWKDERGRARRYACACGAWRPAELMIDVRVLGLTQDFVCDGCWTKWERNGTQVTSLREPANRKEWKRDWCEALGAPVEVLEKIDLRRDAEPYAEKVIAEVSPQ